MSTVKRYTNKRTLLEEKQCRSVGQQLFDQLFVQNPYAITEVFRLNRIICEHWDIIYT